MVSPLFFARLILQGGKPDRYPENRRMRGKLIICLESEKYGLKFRKDVVPF